MNIGQKINEFDNLPEGTNTVEKFNEMFGTDIEGTGLLEIGDLTTGGLREVIINDKTIRLPLERKDIEIEEVEEDFEEGYSVIIDGEEVARFSSFPKIAQALNTSISTVSRYCKNNYDYYGYQIKPLLMTKEEYEIISNLPVKKLPIDKSRAKKSLYIYKVTLKDGRNGEFQNAKLAGLFAGKCRRAVESRVKRNNDQMLSGWKVERFERQFI